MKDSIYQLASKCKSISDDGMGIDKVLIPYRNLMFTDYTVKGAVDEYMSAIDELWCEGIQLFIFYERNEYN